MEIGDKAKENFDEMQEDMDTQDAQENKVEGMQTNEDSRDPPKLQKKAKKYLSPSKKIDKGKRNQEGNPKGTNKKRTPLPL